VPAVCNRHAHIQNSHQFLTLKPHHITMIAVLAAASLKAGESEPAKTVIEALGKTVIPSVRFENVSFDEAVDFLRQRLHQLQAGKDSPQAALSLIYINPENTNDPDDIPKAGMQTFSYTAENKPFLELLGDLCRICKIDAHVTSVGIVLSPPGVKPFPNPKAKNGEIWKTIGPSDKPPLSSHFSLGISSSSLNTEN